jgi:hypothetical protein
MHQLQRSWVRSQHPSAQRNLRGGSWSSAEKSTKKNKTKIFNSVKEKYKSSSATGLGGSWRQIDCMVPAPFPSNQKVRSQKNVIRPLTGEPQKISLGEDVRIILSTCECLYNTVYVSRKKVTRLQVTTVKKRLVTSRLGTGNRNTFFTVLGGVKSVCRGDCE